ncbi:MAG: hypothetical protein C0483_05955 [Pirellula sp.]|nr:hypothetical protein [Pirellula sp.]
MPDEARSEGLWAGIAKSDITDREAGPVNDTLYVRALVLKSDSAAVVIVTVDAVAIGEIGRIKSSFLVDVRSQLAQELPLKPEHVLVNASHCHGVIAADVEQRTVEAVKAAWQSMVAVRVGVGVGKEERVSENRRLRLKDGSEADVRHAYALPKNDDVAGTGPVDPEIGVIRFDRLDGRTLAVVYNFACHPIMGVPSGGNTADFPGFASKAIEETVGDGVMAFFLQGCAGDVNPVRYKDVHQPHDAEPLGNLLGLSVLRTLKTIKTTDAAELRAVSEHLALPRETDFENRMRAIEAEQAKLLGSLKGTSLNFETFAPLWVQYKLAGNFPSYYSHLYLREKELGRDDLVKLDAVNRANIEAYRRNIQTMEQLTRLQTNLALLKKHRAQTVAAGGGPLDVEIAGLRIGDFRIVTFPGELTAQIGLNIKQRATRDLTFVAGYTNGYIYYAPTAEQRRNSGYAQEDCDCLLAPEWQRLFEEKAQSVLKSLE